MGRLAPTLNSGLRRQTERSDVRDAPPANTSVQTETLRRYVMVRRLRSNSRGTARSRIVDVVAEATVGGHEFRDDRGAHRARQRKLEARTSTRDSRFTGHQTMRHAQHRNTRLCTSIRTRPGAPFPPKHAQNAHPRRKSNIGTEQQSLTCTSWPSVPRRGHSADVAGDVCRSTRGDQTSAQE